MGEYSIRLGMGIAPQAFLSRPWKSAHRPKAPDRNAAVEVHSSLGQIEEVEQLLKPLAEIGRFRVEALVHLANLRRHTVQSSIFNLLEKELEGALLSATETSSLYNAMGRILENSGEYIKAFENFAKSKEILKRDFDFDALKRTVDSAIADFSPEALKEFNGYGDPSRLPVFVVGMPRSGTTLTEQIIAAHPKAAGAGELERIGRMRMGLSPGESTAQMLEALRAGGPARVRLMTGSYLGLLKFLAPAAKRIVDKCRKIFCVSASLRCFSQCPDHPLPAPSADTFVSAFQNMMLSNHSYSYSPEEFARYYKEFSRLMAHWNHVLPGRILIFAMKIWSRPETKTRELLEFLRLPWDSRCLRFHETAAAVKTFSKQQVRSPINRNSVGRWRNYREQLQPLLEITGNRDTNETIL